MIKKISLVVGMLGLFFSSNFAQKTYVVYPLPQENVVQAGSFKLSSQFNVVIESGVDITTKERLKQILQKNKFSWIESQELSTTLPNILLGVYNSGEKVGQWANQTNLKKDLFTRTQKYDKHIVSIRKENNQNCILVLGEHTDAVFHGLATLEQILEQEKQSLNFVDIYDFADQKYRGLVEGYYGYPYSVEVKKDLMQFMMRMKMNTYLYGAKSDPYHSKFWRDDYPTTITAKQEEEGWLTQDMLKDISKKSVATKVNFIWAIHPIAASPIQFRNDGDLDQGVKDVMGKFDKMHKLGVRQYAVFVDDAGWDINLSENYGKFFTLLQNSLDSTYNKATANPMDTVKPLHVVPHIYAVGWGGDKSTRYFGALATTPKKVVFYTTGWGVWTVPNNSDLQKMYDFMKGREVAWWWNYPCNDNADNYLYTSDMYTNFHDAPAINNNATLPQDLQKGLGIVSNPMQEGELSKIALFSVADYAWNNAKFNQKESYAQALNHLFATEYREDMKVFLQYAKAFEPIEINRYIDLYKQRNDATKLLAELKKIAKACETVESFATAKEEPYKLFYHDVKPWTKKLSAMVKAVQIFVNLKNTKEQDKQWESYLEATNIVNGLDTAEVYQAYSLEGHGNGISVAKRPSNPSAQYLEPFVRELQKTAFQKYLPKRTPSIENASVLSNVKTYQYRRVKVSNSGIYTFDGDPSITLEPGQYFGLCLPLPTHIDSLYVSSKLEPLKVYYSLDASSWFAYEGGKTIKKPLRYLVFVNETKELVANAKFTSSNFKLYCPAPALIQTATLPEGTPWQNHNAQLLMDKNYNTFAVINRNQKNGDAYTVKLAKVQPIYDVRVCVGLTNGDYMNKGKVQISVDGKTWKDLPVIGAGSLEFTMNMPQVKSFSNEMAYCDFNGRGDTAQYVRLYVQEANTNKWLRLYEIEVNKNYPNKQKQALSFVNANTDIPELYDNQASTFANLKNARSLTYKLISYQKAEKILVLQNKDSLQGGEIMVQFSKDGKTWQDKTSIKDSYSVLPLSNKEKGIRYVKFSWTKGNPMIYEIIEITNPNDSMPLITAINPTIAHQQTELILTPNKELLLQGENNLKALTIFNIQGKKLYHATYAKRIKQVKLPALKTKDSYVILQLLLASGEKIAYKLYLN